MNKYIFLIHVRNETGQTKIVIDTPRNRASHINFEWLLAAEGTYEHCEASCLAYRKAHGWQLLEGEDKAEIDDFVQSIYNMQFHVEAILEGFGETEGFAVLKGNLQIAKLALELAAEEADRIETEAAEN